MSFSAASKILKWESAKRLISFLIRPKAHSQIFSTPLNFQMRQNYQNRNYCLYPHGSVISEDGSSLKYGCVVHNHIRFIP